MGRLSLVEEVFLNLLVVVRAPEVVKDATFIHLKVASQSAFSTRKDSKIGINNVSLNLFIKSE
jgi:hypothetical protein